MADLISIPGRGIPASMVQSGSLIYHVDTGLVNAYVATLNPSSVCTEGMGVAVKIANTNTNTACTLKTDGTNAYSIIKDPANTAAGIRKGDLVVGGIYEFRLVSITAVFYWQLINPQLNAASLLPVGTMLMMGCAVPAGFLACDGSAVSRTTYADLFAALGTSWGAGDGLTTFNLPDLRGKTPIGAGQDIGRGLSNRVLGTYGGEENHTLTVAELAPHPHGITDPGHFHTHAGDNAGGNNIGHAAAGNWSGGISYVTDSKTTGITVNNAGSGTPHNVMQPWGAVNFMIKY